MVNNDGTATISATAFDLRSALVAALARAEAAEAEAARLRDHLKYAKYTMEDVQPEVGYDCECEDCEECGLAVDECSKTDCAKTCNYSTCRSCILQDSIDSIDAILAGDRGAASAGEG